jgi:ribulose-5-phosphate 4-epimerase/fuculose-1-phosphate aldolase
MSETAWRDLMAEHGRSLHQRGLAHGSSGNIS